VAVPKDREAQSVQCFGAFPADLYALAGWLRQCQSETVVLESTGVSWRALFAGLEERGVDVKLVDPHAVRHVPGCIRLVHTPVHASWLKQVEISFSII